VGGWLAVIGCDLVLVHLAPARWVVAALGVGNTAGFSVAAIALVIMVLRVRGRAALRATTRAAAAGLAAALVGAAVGAAAGAAVAHALPSSGLAADCVTGVLAAAAAVAVFAAAAYVLDGGELRAALSRARRGVAR
jgi:putative peptidoglycan lipid II flippase